MTNLDTVWRVWYNILEFRIGEVTLLTALNIFSDGIGLNISIYAAGILAMLLSVIAYQFKRRTTIIVVNFSGQACWVLYFILQSDYTSAVSCALTVMVMMVYSMKDKWAWVSNRLVALTFTVMVVGFSILTFAVWMDIFPLLAGVFAVIANSRTSEKRLRQFSSVWCALWLVNSILKMYPVALVNDVLCTGSTVVSLIRYRNTEPKTKEA